MQLTLILSRASPLIAEEEPRRLPDGELFDFITSISSETARAVNTVSVTSQQHDLMMTSVERQILRVFARLRPWGRDVNVNNNNNDDDDESTQVWHDRLPRAISRHCAVDVISSTSVRVRLA